MNNTLTDLIMDMYTSATKNAQKNENDIRTPHVTGTKTVSSDGDTVYFVWDDVNGKWIDADNKFNPISKQTEPEQFVNTNGYTQFVADAPLYTSEEGSSIEFVEESNDGGTKNPVADKVCTVDPLNSITTYNDTLYTLNKYCGKTLTTDTLDIVFNTEHGSNAITPGITDAQLFYLLRHRCRYDEYLTKLCNKMIDYVTYHV